MIEPTESNKEYGEHKKEIIFRETAKRHADLKIQLQYDGLNMAKFLRQCVSFYLAKDSTMMELIDKMKGVVKPAVPQREVAIVQREREKTKAVQSNFALNEDEVESIFDILEEEHPEL